MRRYKNRISRIVTVVMLFVFLIGNSNMVHAMEKTQVGYASKYITVKGNDMHLACMENWMQVEKHLQMKEKPHW